MGAADQLSARPGSKNQHDVHAVQAMGKERKGPVQGRLYRSLKLWSFCCDLHQHCQPSKRTIKQQNDFYQHNVPAV